MESNEVDHHEAQRRHLGKLPRRRRLRPHLRVLPNPPRIAPPDRSGVLSLTLKESMNAQVQEMMDNLDVVLETASILKTALKSQDRGEAHEAVTVMLLQGMGLFGPESLAMEPFFPVMEATKRRIDGMDLPGSSRQVGLFETQIGEIKSCIRATGMLCLPDTFPFLKRKASRQCGDVNERALGVLETCDPVTCIPDAIAVVRNEGGAMLGTLPHKRRKQRNLRPANGKQDLLPLAGACAPHPEPRHQFWLILSRLQHTNTNDEPKILDLQ